MDQKPVVIYVKHFSPYCWRAKRLLRRKRYSFEELNLTGGGEEEGGARSDWTISEKRVPFVFVDGRGVGGLEEMVALDACGVLDRLVRGEV